MYTIYIIRIKTGIKEKVKFDLKYNYDLSFLYYVGSTKNFNRRYNSHIKNVLNGYSANLYKFIRYYGFLNTEIFKIEQIEGQCDPKSVLMKENAYIDKFMNFKESIVKRNAEPEDRFLCLNQKISYTGLHTELERKNRLILYKHNKLSLGKFIRHYIHTNKFINLVPYFNQKVICERCNRSVCRKNLPRHRRSLVCLAS